MSEQLTAAEGAAVIGAPEQILKSAPAKPRTSQDVEDDIAKRFAKDTANHQMAVLHDDGLYRHLRFTSNPRGYGEYWFDLITWPGCLTVRGDVGDGYTFARLDDMFQFFRADRDINPHYWAEKLGGGRQSVKRYSEAAFRQIVVELFEAAVRYSDAPLGLGKAVRADILDADLYDESQARRTLEDFEFKGFTFDDTWEYSFRDFDPQFLWCCHAIAWGIAQYDAARKAVAA
ncbi:hypothetical protein [Streptomyces niveus]|uniref:hypothetical protein n=1 Tax=Streptomyces niveus TaxID=193462 RepID=UPI00343D5785